MHRLLVCVAFVLAACSPAPSEPPAPDVRTLAEAKVREDMTGRYRVVAVNGEEISGDFEGLDPVVTISGSRIHFQSQCIFADWTVERDGAEVATKRYYEPGSAMCARASTRNEAAIQQAFDEATLLRRIRSGWQFEGGDKSVVLHRVLSEEELARRAVDLSGRWRVVSLDGEAMRDDRKIELSADHEQIWWEPGCAMQGREYRIEGNRFDTDYEAVSGETCDIAFPGELTRAWSAMDDATKIARRDDGSVEISGGDRSIVLTRP